jgi:hypothetical protein
MDRGDAAGRTLPSPAADTNTTTVTITRPAVDDAPA